MTSYGSASLAGLTITLTTPGGRVRNLGAYSDTARWTSAAVGGFGSLSMRVPGQLSRREVELTQVDVTIDQQVLYQGRVEDLDYDPVEDTTELQAFGARRELDNNPVQAVWAQTDLRWREMRIGLTLSDGNTTPVNMVNRNVFTAAQGVVADDDLTIRGLRFAPMGGYTLVQTDAKFMHMLVPEGIRIHKFSCYFESTAQSPPGMEGILGYAEQGVTWTPYTRSPRPGSRCSCRRRRGRTRSSSGSAATQRRTRTPAPTSTCSSPGCGCSA